jgi:hypothetical protein
MGCGPTPAVITDTPGDTDISEDQGETDTDADADTGGDSESTIEGPLSWDGTREFTFSNTFGEVCKESVTEGGSEVTAEAEWASAVASCPACDAVFQVSVSPDQICSGFVDMDTDVVRGVEWGENGGANVYRLDDFDGGWVASPLGEGTYDTDEHAYIVEYDYASTYNGYDYTVAGFAILSEDTE